MSVKPSTVRQYIASKPAFAQQRLNELRACLLAANPNAVDELKWGKPALVDDGILYVYAVFTKHISLHPTPSVIDAFKDQLQAYKLSGNTVQFPLNTAIPEPLVTEMARLRMIQKTEHGTGWK